MTDAPSGRVRTLVTRRRLGDRRRRLRLDGPGPQPVVPAHPDALPGPHADPDSSSCADTVAARRERGDRRRSGSPRRPTTGASVVEHPDVDVVVVTAPNMLHVEIIEAAAAAGKDVFCEKPVGGTPAQTVRARERAAPRGVDHRGRLQLPLGAARAARQAAHRRRPARARSRTTAAGSSRVRHRPAGLLSWRFLVDQAGHGVTTDLLSHAVDLAHAPRRADHRGRRHRRDVHPRAAAAARRRAPTTTAAGPATRPARSPTRTGSARSCGSPSGAVGTFEASRSMIGPESQHAFEVYGTKGAFALEPRADERAAGLPRRRRARHRVHDGVTAATASPTTGLRARERQRDRLRGPVTIEDHEFARRRRRGRPFDPGFDAAVDVRQRPGQRCCGRGSRGSGSRCRDLREDDAMKTESAADHGRGDRALPDRPAHRRSTARSVPLCPGVFAIFGHGNVTCLGPALDAAGDELPTWRGQNEQGMALAAVAFAKAMRRRQFMVATSSIGPGALEHGHRRRRRDGQPPAGAAARRRHVPEPAPRSRAAAGRALRRPVDDGQRRVPARRALLGPDHAAGAGRPVAAAGDRDDARSGRLRAGVPRPAPGRPGARRSTSRPASSSRPSTRCARPRPDRGQLAAAVDALAPAPSAADRRRRRRPLLARRGRAGGVRRAPRHPGRRDGRRQVDAASRPPALRRPDRRHRLRGRQPRWPPTPTSCSPSAPACRTSPPGRGPCSATPTCG